MQSNARADLLAYLAKAQEVTAPVTLQVGRVNGSGSVVSDCVVIHDCPPATLQHVQDWMHSSPLAHEGDIPVTMSVIQGGLLIA